MDVDLAESNQPCGQYTYTRLPAGSRYIRLIRLLPHADRQAPIRCQLIEYQLQRSDDNHLYEALSYVWGDPKETVTIVINGRRLPITINLHAALIRLRDAVFDRILWVDAICIDQTNLKERASQVQFMVEIYASASRVLVWLGEERDGSTGVLRLVRAAAQLLISDVEGTWKCSLCEDWALPNQSCPSCGVKGSSYEHEQRKELTEGILLVHQLLQRPWFTRIWILQEVAAARRVLVLCGRETVNRYAFGNGIESLSRHAHKIPQIEPFPNQIVVPLIQKAVFRSQSIRASAEALRLHIGDLADLVNMFHLRKASDPRDKIYAL